MAPSGDKTGRVMTTRSRPRPQNTVSNALAEARERGTPISRFDYIRYELRNVAALGSGEMIRRATNLLLVLDQISARCKYPIENFESILKAFGSPNATIFFGGVANPLQDFLKVVPKAFFPVQSEDDLLRKLIHHIEHHRTKG